MKTFLARCVAFLSLVAFCTQPVAAQANTNIVEQSLTDMYTVAGLGAAGAVLGLSTLSFVEEPGDHLKNIVVGAAIGVIAGVGVVAWMQAEKSKQSMSSKSTQDFPTSRRVRWHKENHLAFSHPIKSVQSAAVNFSF